MPRRFDGRHLVLALAVLLLVAAPAGAVPGLAAKEDPPHPDPSFAHRDVEGEPCTVKNEYEAAYYETPVGEVRYPGLCKRIKIAFGPILVKPGENDALIEPVDVEKPAYDGYILRFAPNLLRAIDGTPPNTDHMHLHHATWIGISPDGNYGEGPIYASGEEKTVISTPNGYGQPVSADDVWLLLYMVHNEQPTSEVVWLTYELDYIAKEDAPTAGILPAKQIWNDVQGGAIHEDAPSTGGNPVFNVQRGFGSPDPDTGRLVCTWPRENCARHDVYGQVTPQQGRTHDDEGVPYSEQIFGNDLVIPEDLEGTLVHIGGHLHPGGIRDELHLVRDGVQKPIFLSDALYWDWDDPSKVGGKPWSWNFVMTTTPRDWRVEVKAGDRVRINAVVDSEDGSWYEGMGIAMGWIATDGTHGEPSVDVFEDTVIFDRGRATSDFAPEGPYDWKTGWRPHDCEMDLAGDANGVKRLCLRGGPTHPHIPESGNFNGGCRTEGACEELVFEDGEVTDTIVSGGFSYGNADLSVIETTGIPLLRKGVPARFYNADTAARIWHTFTRCAYPCNGGTDMAHPIPDGGKGDPNDVMDFDSNEIGYGTPFEPANGQIPSSSDKSTDQTVRDGAYWEFTPTETGVYTFFCRIHHSMRGAFKVIE